MMQMRCKRLTFTLKPLVVALGIASSMTLSGCDGSSTPTSSDKSSITTSDDSSTTTSDDSSTTTSDDSSTTTSDDSSTTTSDDSSTTTSDDSSTTTSDDSSTTTSDDSSTTTSDDSSTTTSDDSSTTTSDDSSTSESSSANFTRGSLGDNDSVPSYTCDTTVSSTSALENAVDEDMAAGSTICLADGDYTGLELSFGGTGTASEPITVAAQSSGGVSIDGEVTIRMGGTYVNLQGFIFKDGNAGGSDFLQTRLGSDPAEYCYNCRISEIAVIDFDQGLDSSGKWVHLYGDYNRVDHSYFSGKETAGALLIINREIDGTYVTSAEDVHGNYITIDHNYFGDRPPADGKAYADNDDNEYEAVRTGTSEAHHINSNSTVEYNYFEKIQGEAEVISNKASNNTIRYNTIRDSYGSLTNRHGSSTTIAGNVIIGDDYPYAGGLRIVDDGHSIYNNYIEGVRYLDTTHHGGIVLMGSDGAGDGDNGYQQFENVMVANNTIVDSVNSLNVNGGNKSNGPESVYLVNNLIQDGIGAVITQSEDGMPSDSTIEGNIFYGQSFADSDSLTSVSGITWLDADMEEDSLGIERLTESGSAELQVDAYVNSDFDSIDVDMDGQTRSATTLTGSDELATTTTTLGILNRYDVGPMSYTPEATTPHVQEMDIANHDFDQGDSDWTISDGASITTDSDLVFSRASSALIESAGGMVSQEVTIEADTNYTLTAFATGVATLGAEVDGVSYETSINESDYELVTVSFNSGDATSATIYGTMSSEVENSVTINDSHMTDWGDNNDEYWSTYEGDGIGQVQASSNSATSTDGCAKFKYTDASEVGSPEISQLISDLVTDTDYTLSMYVLEKHDTALSLTWGAYIGDTDTVLYSETIDVQALKDSDAEEGEDSFRKVEMSFNNGSNSEITIFARYNAHTLLSDGTVESSETELRVDEFSLTYDGEPDSDSTAAFDSFRLVSHASLD